MEKFIRAAIDVEDVNGVFTIYFNTLGEARRAATLFKSSVRQLDLFHVVKYDWKRVGCYVNGKLAAGVAPLDGYKPGV